METRTTEHIAHDSFSLSGKRKAERTALVLFEISLNHLPSDPWLAGVDLSVSGMTRNSDCTVSA